MLFDAPALLPLAAAQLAPALGHPAWGAEHKHWMRSRLPYVVGAMGIGQEVPSARSRVDIDPRVTDRMACWSRGCAAIAPGDARGPRLHGTTADTWLARPAGGS